MGSLNRWDLRLAQPSGSQPDAPAAAQILEPMMAEAAPLLPPQHAEAVLRPGPRSRRLSRLIRYRTPPGCHPGQPARRPGLLPEPSAPLLGRELGDRMHLLTQRKRSPT